MSEGTERSFVSTKMEPKRESHPSQLMIVLDEKNEQRLMNSVSAQVATNNNLGVSPSKSSGWAAVKSPRSLPRLNVGITSTRNPSGRSVNRKEIRRGRCSSLDWNAAESIWYTVVCLLGSYNPT